MPSATRSAVQNLGMFGFFPQQKPGQGWAETRQRCNGSKHWRDPHTPVPVASTDKMAPTVVSDRAHTHHVILPKIGITAGLRSPAGH